MTREEFSKVVKLLKGYYPKMEIATDSDVAKVWLEALQLMSFDDVAKAIRRYGESQRYAPTIADIKDIVNASPHKVNKVNGCPECGGTGKILVEIKNEESKRLYGEVGGQEFCVPCPKCRGWRYVTKEEAERNGKKG